MNKENNNPRERERERERDLLGGFDPFSPFIHPAVSHALQKVHTHGFNNVENIPFYNGLNTHHRVLLILRIKKSCQVYPARALTIEQCQQRLTYFLIETGQTTNFVQKCNSIIHLIVKTRTE